MIVRMLYTFFWLYLLNPLVVAIMLVGLQVVAIPSAGVLLVFTNTVAFSILWYHIWMWVRVRVRVKNIELDDSVRKALGL